MSAERFTLPSVELLGPNTAAIGRLPFQSIVEGNFGSYTAFNEVVIGTVNVGTFMTFTRAIRNYLYVDITFQGSAAVVTVYGPGRQVRFSQGTSGELCGEYTRRIPYCGDIDYMVFDQINYTVKSIKVVSELQPYSVEEMDLAQFTISNTTGWTLVEGTYKINLASLSGKTVNFGGTLLTGYAGRMGVRIVPSTVVNISPSDTLYSDGVRALSIAALTPVTIWVPETNGVASIVFVNNLNAAVELQLTPTVMSFLGVSTSLGAATASS